MLKLKILLQSLSSNFRSYVCFISYLPNIYNISICDASMLQNILYSNYIISSSYSVWKDQELLVWSKLLTLNSKLYKKLSKCWKGISFYIWNSLLNVNTWSLLQHEFIGSNFNARPWCWLLCLNQTKRPHNSALILTI